MRSQFLWFEDQAAAIKFAASNASSAKFIANDLRIGRIDGTAKDQTKSIIYVMHKDQQMSGGRILRSKSFFVSISPDTGELQRYAEIRLLGSGTNSEVYLFRNPKSNAQVAVKKSLAVSRASYWQKRDLVLSDQHEYDILKVVYGEDNCNIITYFRNVHTAAGIVQQGTSRLIMPYFDGVELQEVVQLINDEHQLARLLLLVVQAVIRLHDKGIIHGDLKEDNILVNISKNEIVVEIIDYANAAFKGQTIIKYDENLKKDYSYMAPERFTPDDKILLADASQDVFSLADCFDNLQASPCMVNLFKQYPSIARFINSASAIDPAKRPKLDEFAVELMRDQRRQTTLGVLCDSLYQAGRFFSLAPPAVAKHDYNPDLLNKAHAIQSGMHATHQHACPI